jgi:RimJ/RimL family protein N-acetyltransferase
MNVPAGRGAVGAPIKPGGDLSWIERDVALRDGRRVGLRAIRTGDEKALLQLLSGLSPESRRRRFFTGAANIAGAAHTEAAECWPKAIGLVATADGDGGLIAHAVAVRGDRHEAEVAFEVADEYHGQGLATLLLIRLAALADSHGITQFVADVLPENHAMLAVFHDAFPDHIARRPGVVKVRFPTSAWPIALARFDRPLPG